MSIMSIMSMMAMMITTVFVMTTTSFCQAQETSFATPHQPAMGGYSHMSVQQGVGRLFLLTIRGTPTDLFQQDLDFMADTFQDIYQQHREMDCGENQDSRLQVIDATIDPNKVVGYGSDTRFIPASFNFSLILQFDVVCHGCQVHGYDLFGPQEEEEEEDHLRDAYEVPFPSSSEPYRKPCVPKNYQDFTSAYIDTVMDMNITGLDTIYDIVPLQYGTEECDGQSEESEFESFLTIAFFGDTSISDLSDQLATVERTFISAYNELNVLNPLTCDPHSRIITTATAELYESSHEASCINLLKVYFSGTYNGCPSDGCLTDDTSGHAICGNHTWECSSNEIGTYGACYCPEGELSVGYSRPTNDELLLAMDEKFEILRNEANFTLVDALDYVIEMDVPDTCCGWPIDSNIPVSSIDEAVVSYIQTGTSPYGYPINCWDISRITSLSYVFQDQSEFNEPLCCWDTSNVYDMFRTFDGASSFNGNISMWDTSNVYTMYRMFYFATRFNGDVSNWDTSQVESMNYMFHGATSFNGDVSNWDTSKVTKMNWMFFRTRSFNGDLSQWDTSKVANMHAMFFDASSFNGDISQWNTSQVTTMKSMFDGATKFNGDVSLWDTSQVTDMQRVFSGASSFNGDVSLWDTSQVTDMSWMFSRAWSFNGDLSLWDTSQVTDMSWMFSKAYEFNGNISQFDTSQVTNMARMFENARDFNGDISQWDTSRVTNMAHMFYSAHYFEGDISKWITSKVTDMGYMFFIAPGFNSDLSAWDTSKVTNMGFMFGATDINSDLSAWDTSRVTSMQKMFASAESFNGNISQWNTSNVINMGEMFSWATSFNGNISQWDTSNVINMEKMFFQAMSFNIDISNWNVSKVTNMYKIFNYASQFQQDLCLWRFQDDNLDYEVSVEIFGNSNCPIHLTDPSPGVGPWCFSC